jgi:hypothetical protein
MPNAIRECQNGSHILLAHFHYINKGELPFRLALQSQRLEDLEKAADLTPGQSRLVKETAEIADARGERSHRWTNVFVFVL